jgi:hypothetical protein
VRAAVGVKARGVIASVDRWSGRTVGVDCLGRRFPLPRRPGGLEVADAVADARPGSGEGEDRDRARGEVVADRLTRGWRAGRAAPGQIGGEGVHAGVVTDQQKSSHIGRSLPQDREESGVRGIVDALFVDGRRPVRQFVGCQFPSLPGARGRGAYAQVRRASVRPLGRPGGRARPGAGPSRSCPRGGRTSRGVGGRFGGSLRLPCS